ncbi:MAG: hypothetical protein H0W97_07220 [Actinobacteria bacterium]|nr:hypothetical protein [Actinomycetota bacterium]
MSTSAETIRPGLAWNATRVAGVLMVLVIAVIALVFWPAFDASDAELPVPRQVHGVAAPHEHIVVDGETCPQCLP